MMKTDVSTTRMASDQTQAAQLRARNFLAHLDIRPLTCGVERYEVIERALSGLLARLKKHRDVIGSSIDEALADAWK